MNIAYSKEQHPLEELNTMIEANIFYEFPLLWGPSLGKTLYPEPANRFTKVGKADKFIIAFYKNINHISIWE